MTDEESTRRRWADIIYWVLLTIVCGGVIGFVWLVVIQIIGLGPAHETTPGRAAFAVLFPTVLCCVTCCAAMAFVAIAISESDFQRFGYLTGNLVLDGEYVL